MMKSKTNLVRSTNMSYYADFENNGAAGKFLNLQAVRRHALDVWECVQGVKYEKIKSKLELMHCYLILVHVIAETMLMVQVCFQAFGIVLSM